MQVMPPHRRYAFAYLQAQKRRTNLSEAEEGGSGGKTRKADVKQNPESKDCRSPSTGEGTTQTYEIDCRFQEIRHGNSEVFLYRLGLVVAREPFQSLIRADRIEEA